MNKITKFIPIFLTPVLAIPALATGCTVKINPIPEPEPEPEDIEEVASSEELLNALNDPEIDKIKLTNDIEMSLANPIEIDHDVTLFADGSPHETELQIASTSSTERSSAFLITGDEINVNIENFDISYTQSDSATDDSIITIDEANASTINFTNSAIGHNNISNNNATDLPHAIRILPNNINGLNITMDSSFLGGKSAVYNQGSNVKLDASNTVFYGLNLNPNDDHHFSTIIVADYPKLNNCFECNNIFQLINNCAIFATDESNSTYEWHQTLAEVRSCANNHLLVDTCTCESTKQTGAESADVTKFNFLYPAIDNFAFADNKWIESYTKSDKPTELTTIVDYYNYYSVNDPTHPRSTITLRNISEEQPSKDVELLNIINDNNAPAWDYNNPPKP